MEAANQRTGTIPGQRILPKANGAGPGASFGAPLYPAISPVPRNSRQSGSPARPNPETPPVVCNADNPATLRCFRLNGDPMRDVSRSVVGAQYIPPLLTSCFPH